MVIGREGEWIIKLGPFTRTNIAGSRKEAEEGATQKILDDGKEIMEKAKVLIPLLIKDAVCPSGGEPTPKEDSVDPQVYSYQVSENKWFAIATSGNFGIKLVCK